MHISGSKIIQKTITPFFSDKSLNCNNMMLNENEKIISDEITIAEKNHFVNIAKKLKLKPTESETNELSLSEVLDKYKDH